MESDSAKPKFPGGEAAFRAFIYTNRRYFEGINRQVIISFIIEKDGMLTNIKVLRGLSKEADQEAIRILEASPKWQPGSEKGLVVSTSYIMPINFSSK